MILKRSLTCNIVLIRGSQGGDQDFHFGSSDIAAAVGDNSTCIMEVGDPFICVQVVISSSEVVCLQKRNYNHIAKSLQWGVNTSDRHVAAVA